MKTTIAQFIPIILIVLLLSFSNEFVNISHTVLGKILALSAVMFYTHLDKYVGLIVCLLVIMYYQSDVVENMLNTDGLMNKMVENFEASQSSKNTVNEESTPIEDMQSCSKNPSILHESMSSLDDVYMKTTEPMVEPEKEGINVVQSFRNENCKNNQLMHKGMKVKPEMVRHVFPEVKVNDDSCNICDSTCSFSIIENRLKNEKELFSVFSRDEDNKPALKKI
jgi:hypothetical protein